MKRREFVGLAALAALGLARGKLPPLPAEPPLISAAQGTFLYLDGGTLDLGLIRDSTLNATNNFEIFAETFENIARIDGRPLTITTAP
jgi:hypothetical protein